MDPIALRSTGPHVEDVQRLLHGIGLVPGDDEPGVFGPATERAVRGLQQRHGLPADGIVDHETWQVLVAASYRLGDRLLFAIAPGAQPVERNPARDKRVQYRLGPGLAQPQVQLLTPLAVGMAGNFYSQTGICFYKFRCRYGQ